MRILQVHTRYRQAGGEDSVVANERDMLTTGGHVVETFEFHNPESSEAAIKALMKSPWNAEAASEVVNAADRFGADVVHVHNTWFALSPVVFRALARAGYPSVATVHNYRLSCVNSLLYRDGRPCEDCVGHVPWRGVWHRCYHGSAIQSAAVAVTIQTHRAASTWEDVDVVVALTEFAASRLIRSGITSDQIVVKPNALSDPGQRTAAPSDSDTVLFVGRLSEEKGVIDLMRAWRIATRGRLRLVVIGAGHLSATLRSVAPPGVEFRGPMSSVEVLGQMKRSRALIVPSRWFEGFPMVLIEGFSAGLPAIVPDHGAFPAVVGEAGWTFGAGDVGSLAHQVEALNDTESVDKRGIRARALYENRYNKEVGLAALEDVYGLAMKRHRQRGRPTRRMWN